MIGVSELENETPQSEQEVRSLIRPPEMRKERCVGVCAASNYYFSLYAIILLYILLTFSY